MARRIYIVDQIDGNTAGEAAASNCPEIVVGVPPRLQQELAGVALPHVYEEPAQAAHLPCAQIPIVEGPPTEAPQSCYGCVPLVFDTVNFRLYACIDGVWKYAQFT